MSTPLQKARDSFTKSNSYLRASRDSRFTDIHVGLQHDLYLHRGDPKFLRSVVEDMVVAGYYSPKIPWSQIERMLLTKLYHLSGARTSLRQFVALHAPHLLKLAWMNS